MSGFLHIGNTLRVGLAAATLGLGLVAWPGAAEAQRGVAIAVPAGGGGMGMRGGATAVPSGGGMGMGGMPAGGFRSVGVAGGHFGGVAPAFRTGGFRPAGVGGPSGFAGRPAFAGRGFSHPGFVGNRVAFADRRFGFHRSAFFHHRHHHRHFGGGFGLGFVTGAALGYPYYGWGYPYYGYGYPYYDTAAYGEECFVVRRRVVNRWGDIVIRRRLVCA